MNILLTSVLANELVSLSVIQLPLTLSIAFNLLFAEVVKLLMFVIDVLMEAVVVSKLFNLLSVELVYALNDEVVTNEPVLIVDANDDVATAIVLPVPSPTYVKPVANDAVNEELT